LVERKVVELGVAWVRVIIVNHNAGPLLQNCIDALAAQSLASFEAIIVDNDSSDGSAEVLRLPDDRFRLHLARANLGFAAANNFGAADCKAPWVATLNPDTVAGKTWLEELRSATLRNPGVKMFGSTQLNARRPDRVDGFGDVYSVFGTAWRGASGSPASALPPDDREVFAPCAASALYSRDAYLAAGGFDESFFCYLEDVDLGFRLALRGERCIQVRRAEIRHFGSVSAGEDSDFFVFHSQRNRLWVLAKNVPSPLIWLVAALQIVVVPVTVLRRGMGKWRTALKGVAAGLRGLPAAWRQRRKVQSERLASSRDIARMLVWDPRKALRHAPKFMTTRSVGAPQAAMDV
jgi:GT2 family glycosyltransferase